MLIRCGQYSTTHGCRGDAGPCCRGVTAVTYISLHVLHVEAVLALLALLVLLLLTAALLDDAEAAGDDEQARYHGDGNDGPGRH